MDRYNLETREAIKDFIDDFMGIFPGLLSEEELLRRITSNMHKNIDFKATLGENIAGQYKDNQVLVSKDTKDVRKVLFHEFIHVITDCLYVREFEYHNFIEGLTTLAEEKYVEYKKIDMKKRRHVNGYIPTFVRQINFVKDNRLLEMFLTNPSDIYKLFHPEVMKFDCPIGHSDKDYRVFFGRLARKNESIVHMARAGCTDDIINGNISDLESDILKQYHISVHIGETKFDSKKFLELYKMQLQPNLGDYLEVLVLLRREGTISDQDILDCGKIGLFYLLNESKNFNILDLNIDVDELDDSELNWVASKLFGFYDIVYSHSDVLDEYSGEEVEEFLDLLFEEQREYEDRLPVYRDLVKEVLRGNLDLENIKDCRIRRSEHSKETSRTADYLLDKPKNAVDLLKMALSINCFPTYILESDNGIDLVYNNDLFYYPMDIVSIEESINNSDVSNKEALINIVRGFSEQQILVCSEFDCDLEYFDEYPFKIYLFDGALLTRVGLENKEESIECKFKQVEFMEDGRNLFYRDIKDKFKVKDE